MRMIFVALVLTAVSTMPVVAQPSLSTDRELEKSIRVLNDAYYASLNARRGDQVESLWAHDTAVTNIFAVDPKPTVGWDSVKSAYDNLFVRFPKLAVAMPSPIVVVQSGMALVVGVEDQDAELANGTRVSAQLPATNVFVKQGDRWLMVHHHSSRPPS